MRMDGWMDEWKDVCSFMGWTAAIWYASGVTPLPPNLLEDAANDDIALGGTMPCMT